MEFTLEEQFLGFLVTSQIFAENSIFEYELYDTSGWSPGENISNIISPGANVLGKRMEHFFSCYIELFTQEEVLVKNQQIIQNKQTLGEIDFLLKDSVSKSISHVEMIYKFYLFDPDTGISELDHLIGPNKRDSLNRKLQRLQKRQFPLLFHEATRDLLNSLKIDPLDVVQKMCFKASVFLPKQLQHYTFSKINSETISGYWIKASEFTFNDYGQNRFFTPKKKYWPVLPQRNTTWWTFYEISRQISPLLMNEFAPLIWMKTPQGNFERFFIVWW